MYNTETLKQITERAYAIAPEGTPRTIYTIDLKDGGWIPVANPNGIPDTPGDKEEIVRIDGDELIVVRRSHLESIVSGSFAISCATERLSRITGDACKEITMKITAGLLEVAAGLREVCLVIDAVDRYHSQNNSSKEST